MSQSGVRSKSRYYLPLETERTAQSSAHAHVIQVPKSRSEQGSGYEAESEQESDTARGSEQESETRSETRREQGLLIVEAESTLVEIEKIWLIRKEGRAFPSLGSDERWELVKFAEEFWREEAALSAGRADVASTNLVASTNQLYQVIGFYIVFQGVLLSACVQTNRLTCSSFKFPLTLCTIATACTWFGVINKFRQIHHFWIEKFDFNDQNRFRESQLTDLREDRNVYNFKQSRSSHPTPSDAIWKILVGGLVVTAVLAFAATNLFLIQLVLCP